MEKISNILPNNRRIATVDTENQAMQRVTSPNSKHAAEFSEGIAGDFSPMDKVSISPEKKMDPTKGLAEKEKVEIAERATKSFWGAPAPAGDLDVEGDGGAVAEGSSRGLSIYA